MNRTGILCLTLAFGAAGLAGCTARANGGGGLAGSPSNICTPFATTQANGAVPAPTANDPGAKFDDCVHRWAYTLAGARDVADVVANATVAACGASLTAWNQQSLGQAQPETDATSLTTGEPTTMVAERARYAQSRALFYVVQARAGNCAAPTKVAVAGEP